MDIRIEIANEICEVLRRNNIKHFVDFGTLLGLHRNKKIIENDYDFDIFAYFDKPFDIMKEFNSCMKKYKLNFQTRLYSSNIVFKHNDFVFEIYRYTVDKNRFYPIFMPERKLPTFFIDELDTITHESGITFNCPKYIDKYLTHRYGSDYMTPQKVAPDGTEWCYVNYDLIPAKNEYVAYTTGVFDLFHVGHVKLFQRIKKKYDKLIVGIHNDEQTASYKRRPIIKYSDRLEIIKSCKYVDEIHENAETTVTDDILNKLNADFLIAGKENENFLKKLYPVSPDRLVLLDRTSDVSTSDIIKSLRT